MKVSSNPITDISQIDQCLENNIDAVIDTLKAEIEVIAKTWSQEEFNQFLERLSIEIVDSVLSKSYSNSGFYGIEQDISKEFLS